MDFYAVALSLMPEALIRECRLFLSDYSAKEIFNKIRKDKRALVVKHIACRYGNDLLHASEKIIDNCNKNKFQIVTIYDKSYPRLLREINQPPLVFYLKGNPGFEKCLAIVGTRKSDKYADYVTQKLARELGLAGFTIISGMARGIDRNAHLGALNEGLPTIGVLANGIDKCYPLVNQDLFNKIINSDNSGFVSEYPPTVTADKWTFVRRNRIISGLCYGVIVVKAAIKSGALITARYAIEQNRDLFVCPGHSFDKEYAGCHRLIKEGAMLISESKDILDEYNIQGQDEISVSKNIPDASKKLDLTVKNGPLNNYNYAPESLEAGIINTVKNGEKQIDLLIRKHNLSASQAGEILTNMELDGTIRRNGDIIILQK